MRLWGARDLENSSRPGSHLNCIDLFSGAGGFSVAAASVGIPVRLAIESNLHAANTLSNNIALFQDQPCKVLNADIKKLSAYDLATEYFGDDEQCHLVLGGPPCQGFSSHRLKNAGVKDSRNSLIHTYFDFVRAFRPMAFLMENVPGMLWDRHKDYVDDFYAVGSETGYSVLPPVVLDARDYGVPQRRKRVFILGLSSEVSTGLLQWPPNPTHGSPTAIRKDPTLEMWKNCDSVFEPARSGDPNDIHMNHSPELISAFEKTPKNGGSRRDSGRLLPCHVGHDGHKDVYGRIDPSVPAPTMTTACINPSKGRFVHPVDNHGITVRQAARIQTFPDSYVFEGGLTAAGKQVGNAVPVDLAKLLVGTIGSFLKGEIAAKNQTNEKQTVAAE